MDIYEYMTMKMKKAEKIVLKALLRNKKARCNDFILYGSVLKELGVDLKKTSLYDYLATAKENKMPPFETISRCRRHIQELMPELKDGKVAIKREDMEEIFINYNLTGIGE